MEAVKNKNEEIALLLLRNGADPETTDNVRGRGCVSISCFFRGLLI